MNKLLSRELEFIFDPSYSKISKKVDLVIKELSNIVGTQYKSLFKERIDNTNFVFYNRMTDLEKYLELKKDLFTDDCDKKTLASYKNIKKEISTFKNSVDKIKNKFRTKFINEACDFLCFDDQNYIRNHKKFDYSRLCCYPLFFNDNSNRLIDGLISYFSDDMEERFRNVKTDNLELERITNSREMCLKLLGLRNVNLNTFDLSNISELLVLIDKYNNLFAEEYNKLNLNNDYICDNFLFSKEKVSHMKDNSMKKNFEIVLKEKSDMVDSINNDILDVIYNTNESTIIYLNENFTGEKIRFALFSPCMNYEYLDYLFIRQICKIAFECDNTEGENVILGNERYFNFYNLFIDYVASLILENINNRDSKIICFNTNLNVHEVNDGLFLLDKFYKSYSEAICASMVENNKTYFYDLVGLNNFENYVDIVNKYYYDRYDRTAFKRSANYIEMIRNILDISLSNMEQYRKILLDKDRYDFINGN